MRRRISIRGRVRPSVGPSVRISRVIFEGEKYAYKAHPVPCIRPCFKGTGIYGKTLARFLGPIDHFPIIVANLLTHERQQYSYGSLFLT